MLNFLRNLMGITLTALFAIGSMYLLAFVFYFVVLVFSV
jgi:hypothetical protein